MKTKILLALVSTIIVGIIAIVLVVEGSRAYFELALTVDIICFIGLIIGIIGYNINYKTDDIKTNVYWYMILLIRLLIVLSIGNAMIIMAMSLINKELM